MSKKDEWSLLTVVEKTAKEMANPDLPPKLVKEIFKILQNYQYRTNRDRPREMISRLIDSYDWSDN
tara:strand:+ start:274 stop:471 length:198 start_codon:yes stop_codon:yes gene_type:complete